MAFLPDGSLLVNDISGKMYKVSKDGKRKIAIKGVPYVYYRGQGGLLDVEIHPNFEENNFVYISYSDVIDKPFKTISFTAVAKAKLIKDELKHLKVIYRTNDSHYTSSPYHFGSRIAIDEKYIYFSIGDRGKQNDAQDKLLPSGKIHRINLDGSIPIDNPFLDEKGNPSSIYCYGNRNPQGLAFDASGRLWELEHGPKGGDELNIIEKGKNYGWPIITYGVNYNGTKITDITHKEGMEQPVWHWTPSIAVCGMKIYKGEEFGSWNGNILVTSLKFEYLERVVVNDRKMVEREIIYEPGSRVRDVEIDPLGNIYVALENPGRIVKLSSLR
jgi:glucose/arabinose dehydrogenase